MEKSGEIILYKSDNGDIKLNVLFENETIWLSQKQMSELFDTSKQNISLHLQNCFDSGELIENGTVKDFLIVQKEGNRKVKREGKIFPI